MASYHSLFLNAISLPHSPILSWSTFNPILEPLGRYLCLLLLDFVDHIINTFSCANATLWAAISLTQYTIFLWRWCSTSYSSIKSLMRLISLCTWSLSSLLYELRISSIFSSFHIGHPSYLGLSRCLQSFWLVGVMQHMVTTKSLGLSHKNPKMQKTTFLVRNHIIYHYRTQCITKYTMLNAM